MNHAARLPLRMSAARDRVASPFAPGVKAQPRTLRQAVTLRRQSQTSA